jgi:hypothetical protein
MKKSISIVVLILSLIVIAGCTPAKKQDGKYAAIAKCLTEKGVIFYGAYWCPHCADQKKIFGDDLKYIKYVECDPQGENADPAACQKAGITHYPTWSFPGQDNLESVHQPEELAQKANCDLTGLTQQSQNVNASSSPATQATAAVTAAPASTQIVK